MSQFIFSPFRRYNTLNKIKKHMKDYIHNEIDRLKKQGHRNIFLLMSKKYERELFTEQGVSKASSVEEEFKSVTVLIVESKKVKDWVLTTEI